MSCPTWLCRVCGVQPQQLYVVILKGPETPSSLTNGKGTPNCAVLELTQAPLAGCSGQVAGVPVSRAELGICV